MSVVPADLLRLAVIALGALVVGAVLAVMRLHWTAVRRAPSGSGLLPRHVLAVSVAHLCYVIGVGLGVLEGIGQPAVSGRLWFYVTGSGLTLVALLVVGRSQRRRVRRAESPAPVSPDLVDRRRSRRARHRQRRRDGREGGSP